MSRAHHVGVFLGELKKRAVPQPDQFLPLAFSAIRLKAEFIENIDQALD